MRAGADIPALADVLAWLDREHRMQYRAAAERVALPLTERIESGGTIAGLRLEAFDGQNSRCRTAVNASKLRAGDRADCHPEDQPVRLDAVMREFRPGVPIHSISADG